MKPLLPNTYVINNKYLQSILSPSTDIIDYNFTPDQIHKLNLVQILRPDLYFNKKLIFQNSISPIQSLLNRFHNEIISNKITLSQKLITASCKTTQKLEKFYNC